MSESLFHRAGPLASLPAPRFVLLAVLAAAIALGFSGSRMASSVRSAWREALRPGLQAMNSLDDCIVRWHENLLAAPQRDLDEARQQVTALTEQLRERDLQLQLARSDLTTNSIPSYPNDGTNQIGPASILPPLLNCRTISARVLGQQPQSFFARQDLIDLGRSSGISAKSLVIDATSTAIDRTLLDAGSDAALKPDHLVLAGRSIFGKVAEVGQHTSTVLRLSDAGYRDVVQLATARGGRLQFTTRGVLRGTGDPRSCKIELIETSAPVNVGDQVFSVDDGVLDVPLWYGRVIKAERKPAASHWEIWMQPAIATDRPPNQVAVLQMELNPARVAAAH